MLLQVDLEGASELQVMARHTQGIRPGLDCGLTSTWCRRPRVLVRHERGLC
jgi:hypothetical protein